MYRASVVFDTDLIDHIQHTAATFPDLVADYVRREVRPFVSQEVDKRLRQPPGKVQYPIEWTSEKQRKAFFATDGFGHGIPYRRTGKLVASWQVRGDYTATFSGITVTNTSPVGRYVVGMNQQQFHANTGWPYGPSVLQAISLLANDFATDGMASLLAQTVRGG